MTDEHARRERFDRVIAAIDDRNRADPTTIAFAGDVHPKELLHADRMLRWVQTLDPDADDAQLLAARAHHVERWVLDRASYPDGRAGYLRWRRDLSAHHCAVVAEQMAAAGFEPDVVERVVAIVGKRGLRSSSGVPDPAVQVHEDALCLVFIETQFADLSERLGREHMVQVVARTVRKMSPAGIAAAAALPLPADLREVLLAGVAAAADPAR